MTLPVADLCDMRNRLSFTSILGGGLTASRHDRVTSVPACLDARDRAFVCPSVTNKSPSGTFYDVIAASMRPLLLSENKLVLLMNPSFEIS